MLRLVCLTALLVFGVRAIDDIFDPHRTYTFLYHDRYDLLLVYSDNHCYYAGNIEDDADTETKFLVTHRSETEQRGTHRTSRTGHQSAFPVGSRFYFPDHHQCRNNMASKLARTLRLTGVRFMSSSLVECGSGVNGTPAATESVTDSCSGGSSMAVARETSKRDVSSFESLDNYLRKLQALQIQRLKDHLEDEVDYQCREKTIREHQEAIERHKKRIQKIHHQQE